MGRSNHKSVSLDQLIALCDEMRALVRSGVPLEAGLKSIATDLPGKQAALAAEIGRRGEEGESIEQILSRNELSVPDLFRSIVLAGIRAGRLSAALEGMSMTARRLAELRRSVAQAMIYPLLVVSIVCVLTVAMLGRLGESYLDTRQLHGLVAYEWMYEAMQWLSEWLWMLAPAAVLLFLLWSFVTARALAMQSRRAIWFSWLPWTRRLLKHGRLSTFLEVLALLIENDVPLSEALTLSASASGDDRLARDAKQLSEQLVRGGTISGDSKSIPPLVRWQLVTHTTKEQMVASLRAMSRSERSRADYLAEWLRIQLPVIFTVAVGGSVTLVYALAVLLPWYSMLRELSDPMAMLR